MVYENLVKHIINNGGFCKPLYINSGETGGTGLCNASILYSENKLRMILRNVEYTLYHAEGEQKFQSRYEGPLSYYHRDNDLNLRTTNIYCEVNPITLEIEKSHIIDTTKLDTTPLWNFIGLEDARLIFWNSTYYICGVRRDTRDNGQGRMELSELELGEDYVKEISRNRIEVENPNSYCEKNWMPIKNLPFHFIKWTNPTEIVKVDMENNIATSIYHSETTINDLPYNLRGGSHVIKWDEDCYLSITHECKFIPKNFNGYKDVDYYHRFVIWDKNWNIKHISRSFNFMTAKVEFCIGLEQINDDIIIVIGFQDNGAYAIKLKKYNLNKIIWNLLKRT
jgi:hypothetical protein